MPPVRTTKQRQIAPATPSSVANNVTGSIEALRSTASLLAFTQNRTSCPVSLAYQFEEEARAASTGRTPIPARAELHGLSAELRDYLDALFPSTEYSEEWKAKPGNMLVMNLLGTCILGFPKQNNETDEAHLQRANQHGRTWQQLFPLPPEFDCDHVIDNEHLGEPILIALLVSLWAIHKRVGVSKSTLLPGFPMFNNSHIEEHWCKVDKCFIGVLVSIHFRGFGKKQLFIDALPSINAQANRKFIGAATKQSCEAFVRYLHQHHNFPEDNFWRFNVDVLLSANMFDAMKGLLTKLGRHTYSNAWIRSILVDHMIPKDKAQQISGGLFYKNFLLLDMLVPTFRFSKDAHGRPHERCKLANQHLTPAERARGFPDGGNFNIYEAPFPNMVSLEKQAIENNPDLGYESETF